MTSEQKVAKLEELRAEAKDYQLRYGYLTLQIEQAQKELEAIRTLMAAGETKFTKIQQEAVDADE